MRQAGPRDAVITGAGCVTALAFGLGATYEAIREGATGVRALPDAPAGSGLERAALVEPPWLRTAVPRELEAQIKFLSGSGALAVEATAEACAEAGLQASAIPPERRGLYLAQMDSGDWACGAFHDAMRAAAPELDELPAQEALNRACVRKVKPFFMLESLKNNAFSFLATQFELRGPNTSVAGYAGPTWACLDLAVRSLARGSLDAAVVVAAARAASETARAELDALGLDLSPGEAAAALVMERRAEAHARGAPVRAVVLGTGASTRPPAEGRWAPPPQALVDAAGAALDAAGLRRGELGAVVAPDVGEGDLLEILGDVEAAAGVPVRAFKAETGHCALATDVLEAALVTEALRGRDDGPVLLLTAGLLGQVGALVLARDEVA
jgi:3-oxoacyl-[acyl-carrier-protein] synthase II